MELAGSWKVKAAVKAAVTIMLDGYTSFDLNRIFDHVLLSV